MKNLIRIILAILAGVLIGVFTIYLFEFAGSKLFPPPFVPQSPQDMERLMNTMPLTAKLVLILGYATGSFLGAHTAARISHDKKLLAGMAVGFCLLLFGIVLFISIPHPWWLSITSCISYILFAYCGSRVVINTEKK